jgi:hypothetical protein
LLVAVEGPSAVGKTTLLANAAPADSIVGEEWEAVGIPQGSGPSRHLSPEAQRFWVRLHAGRWGLLREVEDRCGTAYADTDPLKLYYNFALVRAGELPREVFEAGWRLTRQAVEGRRLGFVDRVVYLKASRDALARRKAGDASRTRRNFELHSRLVDHMESYYAALERLRPGSVFWLDAEGEATADGVFAAALSEEAPRRERYDVALLDRLKRELDPLLPGGT